MAGYVLALLAVQPFLGYGIDLFKARWGEAALDGTASVIVGLGAAGVLLFALRIGPATTLGERLWILTGLVLYGLGAATARYPQERLHYLGYGLLAGLLYFGLWQRPPALRTGPGGPWRLAGTRLGAGAGALLLGAGVGLLDEVLQILWPRRYFDWTDVGVNCLSVALGLVVAVPACSGWVRRRPQPAVREPRPPETPRRGRRGGPPPLPRGR